MCYLSSENGMLTDELVDRWSLFWTLHCVLHTLVEQHISQKPMEICDFPPVLSSPPLALFCHLEIVVLQYPIRLWGTDSQKCCFWCKCSVFPPALAWLCCCRTRWLSSLSWEAVWNVSVGADELLPAVCLCLLRLFVCAWLSCGTEQQLTSALWLVIFKKTFEWLNMS